MNAVNSDKFVPRRAEAPPTLPPLLPPRPRDAGRLLRTDDSDLPPSYEASTLRRPSDAHIRVAVRSSQHASNSNSSLPSLFTGRDGRTSINTQGYLLTTPMSASNIDRYDHWGQSHAAADSSSGCCCSDSEGCCFSSRGGCVFSDRDGCCWGDRGGFFCSDREGCCCSDTNGCCFSSNMGACCSDGRSCCCSKFDMDDDPPGGVPTTTVETSSVRYSPR